MKPTTKYNIITYAIVIIAYIFVTVLGATGHISSLMEGLLVPLCIYVILAANASVTMAR